MQPLEGGGVAVADGQLAGLDLFRPEQLLLDVALQIERTGKPRAVLFLLRQADFHLHFRVAQLHFLAFFQPRALFVLMDVDGQLGDIVKGVLFEIFAVHIFEVEGQVLAVAEVAFKSVLVLILDDLYGCPQELSFLPTGVGGEGTAAHLTILTHLPVLLKLLYASASHHQHHPDTLLAHLYLDRLLTVPVHPLLVDAHPVTDLLLFAGDSDDAMREQHE